MKSGACINSCSPFDVAFKPVCRLLQRRLIYNAEHLLDLLHMHDLSQADRPLISRKLVISLVQL